jgi:ubiquinone/menaquinone biosynthesis C-methylase UbiE
MDQSVEKRMAELYDVSVPDWLGEIEFYRALATEAMQEGQAVLEVASGTGRVAIRLAQEGVRVVGLDLSPAMLDVAREKSGGLPSLRWVQGDMRSFDLGEAFGLAIIPGHAFQNLLTPEDQVACLACIKEHLVPGGTLVVHLDHPTGGNLAWLGAVSGEKKGVFERTQEVRHPGTGRLIQVSRAWSYEASTQMASVVTVWEETDADGKVVDYWQRGPIALHCVFRFEMEHLLARVGLTVEGLYGDFLQGGLEDDSTEMVWVARR